MGKVSTLLSDLLQIDVFKVGEFMLKGNHPTPFYIDLRHVISHPMITNNVVRDIWAMINEKGLTVDSVCGVPYNALPFASVLSSRHEVPMLLKRKEAKSYGTKKLLEGVVRKGTTCLILEDVVVSGASIKETADTLRKEGLVVTDCICILDRLQGAKDNLLKFGIRLHSLFDIEDILTVYSSFAEIKPSLIEKVRVYLKHNVCTLDPPPMPKRVLISERTDTCASPVLRRLCTIIEKKKSNLCVAVDVVRSSELLEIVSAVGPHVCMIKMHVDILTDFSSDLPSKLVALARKHDFLILEDRKFSDAGPTVLHQYKGGMFNISEWADVVTVHGVPNTAVLESLKKATGGKERACLLVAQMETNALTDCHYVQQVIQLAESDPAFVMGVVSHKNLSKDFFHLSLCGSAEEDPSGPPFSTPEEAVTEGADVVIVGKEVYASSDIARTAAEYKNRAYGAYLDSILKIR